MKRIIGLIAWAALALIVDESAKAVTITSSPQGFSRVVVQTFCSSGCTATAGPYTPTSGMVYADILCLGGGGGGGGVAGSTTGDVMAGGGGGGGSLRALGTGATGGA